MKKYLLIRLLGFSLMTLFINCSNNLSSQDTILIGKYHDSTGFLTLDFQKGDNSISGTHCFVTYDGKNIDCCPEKDSVSIILFFTDSKTLKGTFTSYYDYSEYEVEISIRNKYFEFRFNDKHPFLPRRIKFYPKKW